VWPLRDEALTHTIRAEEALDRLWSEALRRWLPAVRAAVLPSLTADAAGVPPPDPGAVEQTSGAWQAAATAVITVGLSAVWAVSYTQAAEALGTELPEPDTATDPPLVDAAVLRIVADATDYTRGEVLARIRIVNSTPALAQNAQEFATATAGDAIQTTPARVAEQLAARITELSVEPDTRPNTLRADIEDDLHPNSNLMRAYTMAQSRQAAAAQNSATLAAAAGSSEPLEKTWICVHPDTVVRSDEALAVARRWHSGLMVTVRTSGDPGSLTVTPEHKVLTGNRGWVRADDLREGDNLIEVDWGHAVGSPDVEDEPASISQIADPFFDAAAAHQVRPVGGGVDFDVEHPVAGDVQVVRADRVLRDRFNAGGGASSNDIEFMLPDLARDALFGERSAPTGFLGNTLSGEGGAGLVVSDSFGGGVLAGCAQHTGLGLAAGADTLLIAKDAGGGLRGAADPGCDVAHGHSGQVKLVQVVGIDVGAFSGHVYDLQTLGYWFTANKVAVHNCTIDGKTRPSHFAADGQRVPLGGKFTIGGAQLDYPGDQSGPPEEWKNCRCRIGVLAPGEAIPDEVDRHTERLDGRDSVAINRNGRTQREEIDRRADAGNVRARDAKDGVGRVAAATPGQETEMKFAAQAVTAAGDTGGGELFRTFTDQTVAFIGTPTSDGRVLASGIELSFRSFPLPLMWCKQSTGGHSDSFTVGVIEDARVDGDRVVASGYLLNTEEAGEAADQLAHKVTSPSVDLAAAEWTYADENGAELDGEQAWDREMDGLPVFMSFTAAELIGTTLVATAAFGDTGITLNAERESRDVALVASAAEEFRPKTYDHRLFEDPGLSGPTAPTMGADGRIFGHLAVFGECHRSIQTECVMVPRSPSGYGQFHTSPGLLLDDGSRLPVGRLTVGTGHADARAAGRVAAAHYDNTGACFALVRVGEDAHGVWFSGVAAPWATAEQIEQGVSAPLSGDWRDFGQGLDLVAALAVNTPGFAARGSSDEYGRPVALVASMGVPPSRRRSGGAVVSREDIKAAVREALAEAAMLAAAEPSPPDDSGLSPSERVAELLGRA